ncbi:hypothetical protein [Jiangella sp. DSM 45060]|nr:hypothetical protein [Jiangella sp. DSM 45060]
MPPESVAAAVLQLAGSDDLGRVLVLRGGRAPGLLDPAPFE